MKWGMMRLIQLKWSLGTSYNYVILFLRALLKASKGKDNKNWRKKKIV